MRRRIGLGWSDAAYNEIVARLLAPLADHDREDWLYVFRQTRSGWRSAYERQPVTILGLVDLIKYD